MNEYYKVDMSKLSYAEAWRWGGFLYVILITVWKLKGNGPYGPRLVPAKSGIVHVDSDETSADQRAAIEPVLEQLRDCGFGVVLWYRHVDSDPADGIAVAALSRTAETMGQIACTSVGDVHQVSLGLVTTTGDGEFLTTSNARVSFAPPPEIDSVRLLQSPVSEIVRKHSQRVDRMSKPPIRITDVERLITELQTVICKENLRRGLYVPA